MSPMWCPIKLTETHNHPTPRRTPFHIVHRHININRGGYEC